MSAPLPPTSGPSELQGKLSYQERSRQAKEKEQELKLAKSDWWAPFELAREPNTLHLLVIDFSSDWKPFFKSQVLNGSSISVHQTSWDQISLVSSSTRGCVVHVKADAANPLSGADHSFSPDFCLIRNFPTGLHASDHKNTLMGLRFANIPSVNSLHSIFMGMHRPLQVVEMLDAQKRVESICRTNRRPPSEAFVVVPMQFHPCIRSDPTAEKELKEVLPTPTPCVVKVSTVNSGYGKMRARADDDLDDLRSILALNCDYWTAEPLVQFEYEYRIQKIGDQIRGFRRNSSTSWKNNWGNLLFEDYPLQEYHRMWINECSKMWGGLDITAMDVLHRADGSAIVLEMNDTACGLMFEHEQEDMGHIRDLVMVRMAQLCTRN